MRTALVLSFPVFACPVATFAQVSHISANRIVSASGGPVGGPGDSEHFTTRDYGLWEVRASVRPLASAQHLSTIGDSFANFHGSVGAGGGGGYWGSASTSLEWTFTIDRDMRWDLTYVFDSLPNGASWGNSLARVGDSRNLFESVQWNRGYRTPVEASGYLGAGTYRLYLWTYANGGVSTTESTTFALSVPAPSTAVLATAGFIAVSRRRR